MQARNEMAKRVWMITGASRGLGACIARAVLRHGDSVVATARDRQTLASLGDHDNLIRVGLDVTREAEAEEAASAAIHRFGRIDVLVNNAGYGLLGAVEEASADEVRRLYETNVFGLLNVVRAVLPHMRARRSGRVINFSSIGAIRAAAGFGVYCSTKFAVDGLSESLRAELAPLGIHVTAVQPGYFRTDFLDGSSLATSPRIIDDYADTAGRTRQVASRIHRNQPGDPEKLAEAILALAALVQPPAHLALGSDAAAALREALDGAATEADKFRALSLSTDY